MALIHGTHDPAFVGVRDVFASLFTDFGESGAAVAVVAGGKTVVDLWGGTTDGERPWNADTVVHTYSATKPFAAITLLHVLASAHVDLDAHVATVWPEFGKNGKSVVTFRQLIAHQAGLPAFSHPPPVLTHSEASTIALADMAPLWKPGTAHGEHALTYGHLLGEPVRRITGDSIGTVLRRHITGPLDVAFSIGVGDARSVATVVDPSGDWGERLLSAGNGLYRAALGRPRDALDPAVINSVRWRRAEIASVNGHGTALGLARFYAAMLDGGGGALDPGIVREAVTPQMTGLDLVLDGVRTWGLGVAIEGEEFGMGGIGGYVGLANITNEVAFGFVTRTLSDFDRADALLGALNAV